MLSQVEQGLFSLGLYSMLSNILLCCNSHMVDVKERLDVHAKGQKPHMSEATVIGKCLTCFLTS